MLDNLNKLYEQFFKRELSFQKEMDILQLEKMIIITGTTWAWKSTMIQKLNLPHLISYKTWGNNIQVRNDQIYLTPEKFAKKLEKGEFFDVYKLNNKYYAYALRDYFVILKEYWKVIVEISLENLVRWIHYTPKKIAILSPSKEQLYNNIQKRALVRNYTKDKIKEVFDRQDFENKMAEEVLNLYSNSYICTKFTE